MGRVIEWRRRRLVAEGVRDVVVGADGRRRAVAGGAHHLAGGGGAHGRPPAEAPAPPPPPPAGPPDAGADLVLEDRRVAGGAVGDAVADQPVLAGDADSIVVGA